MMNKFLTLTNGAMGAEGTPLAIVMSEVQTVHRKMIVKDDDSIGWITVVYCEKLGAFEVEDTFEQVMSQLTHSETAPKSRFGLQWLKNYRAKF